MQFGPGGSMVPVVRSREVALYGPTGATSNVMSPEEVSHLRETLGPQGDDAMGKIGDVENKAGRMIAEQRL
eukprot:7097747-Karenia_brevis.AAC.1